MIESSGSDARKLIEKVAKLLVDATDDVFVEQLDGDVIELEVAEDEVGKIIGRQGRTVRAMRALLAAVGARTHRRYQLEIIE